MLGGILVALLTRPVYRGWVTLEANPPVVSVSDEQSRQQEVAGSDTYSFVATQVGLVQSRSVAQRAAQELDLANNPDVVPQGMDASKRLRAATSVIAQNLKVIPPDEGQLIKFSFDSTSPQLAAAVPNAVADSFINTAIQRRYEASAYARNFLERQINKTRGDLEHSERALVAYAQAQGIINTAAPDGPIRRRHQFAAGRIAGQAERGARRRDGAARGRRRRLSQLAVDRADRRRHGEHAPAPAAAARSSRRRTSRSGPS